MDAVLPVGVVDHVSRAADVEMVMAGDPTPNFPSNPSINLDGDEEVADALVLVEINGEIR